jgi:hypothetical protein
MSRFLQPRWIVAALAAVLAVHAVITFVSSGDASEAGQPTALTKARALLVEVDHAELCHWQRYGRYGNLPDLGETMEALDPDRFGGTMVSSASEAHLDLDLQLSRSGRSYVQRITGRGVDTYVERRGADFVDFGSDGWNRLKKRCDDGG